MGGCQEEGEGGEALAAVERVDGGRGRGVREASISSKGSSGMGDNRSKEEQGRALAYARENVSVSGTAKVESLSDVELAMHNKWNVSFKKQSGGEEVMDERQAKHLARMEEEELRRILMKKEQEREERERAERERTTTTSGDEEVDDRKRFILGILSEAKEGIPEKVRIAFTSELVQLLYDYSSLNKAIVKVSFPKAFSPESRLVHVEVASKTLHEEVVQKLGLGLQQEVQKGSGQGANPITAVHSFCTSFLGKNHLLTAYEEIQRIKKEVLAPPSKLLGLENGKGAVKCRLQVEKYYIDIRVRVFCKNSVDYPDGNVEVSITESNLPKDLEKSFLALAEARIRLHGDEGEHLDASILDDRPPEKEVQSKMKKKIHWKKEVNQTHASSRTEAEMKYKAQERERERVKRALEEARKGPKKQEPRIYTVVKFALDDLLNVVVKSKCPICDKKVLPSDPKHCSKIPSKMKADRLYCGHFYHHHCLETYMSNPPFDDTCHVCGAQINHHRFSDTREQLEKRWAQKQARQREIQDLEDLFGM